jgi:hypothetical protein
MNDDRATDDPDHWVMFAQSMDLTIEGHRLIAEEIILESKLLWRMVISRLNDLAAMAGWSRTSPPA